MFSLVISVLFSVFTTKLIFDYARLCLFYRANGWDFEEETDFNRVRVRWGLDSGLRISNRDEFTIAYPIFMVFFFLMTILVVVDVVTG